MTADEFFGLASQHLPTSEWIARQVSEACGWEPVPDYLVRDRDRLYGEAFARRIRAMGIRDRPTAPRSPWQNGYAETGQGLAPTSSRPCGRQHSSAADPRRIAPCYIRI